MPLSSPVQRFGNALRTHGPWRTARMLGSRLHREFFPPQVSTHPFDLKYSVDTSGLLFAEHLASGHAHDDHINAYWGTAPSGFRGVLHHWRQLLHSTAYAIEDYTFLDIGCGKGRALMLASESPFRRIAGVELNPELCAIANSNLAQWNTAPHPCRDIQVLNLDALAAPIPDSPVVLYIYNSFNLYVMMPLLERLTTLALTRSTPIDLIYAQPQQSRLIENVPGVILLADGSIPLTAEDKAACAFATTQLDFRIYRIGSR